MAYRRSWQRDFDRSIRENPDWPVVVSQGDSWFSYPHEKNVIDCLDEPRTGRDEPDGKGKSASQRDWSLLRLERTQDEILGVMTGGERAFLNEILHRYEVDALLFSAGGIATPADAALMLQLGAEGVFVGSGIYKSEDPPARARAIVEAATHFRDPEVLARVSRGLKDAMPGIEISSLAPAEMLQGRGW